MAHDFSAGGRMIHAPNIGDQRVEPRTPHSVKLVIVHGNGDEKAASLLDCSPHGVGLLTTDPINANTSILLKLQGTTELIAAYEVRNCRPVPGGYRVGAKFTGFIGSAAATLEAEEAFERLVQQPAAENQPRDPAI